MANLCKRRSVLRTILATLGGGIAGCSSRSTRSPTETVQSTSTADSTSSTTKSETTLLETIEENPLPASGKWPTFHRDNRNSSHAADASGVPEKGTPYWKLRKGLPPIISDQALYTRIKTRGIVACDAQTGTVDWTTEADVGGEWLALADGNLVVTTITDAYSIDVRTGSISWSQSLPRGRSSAPKIQDGMVYFCKDRYGDTPAKIYALNSETGERRWTKKLDGRIGGTVAVTQETVFVSADDLHAFDSKTGTGRWTVSTPGSVGVSPVVSDGYLYAVDEDGAVFAIRAKEGTVDWRTDVGSPHKSGGLAVTDRTVYYCGRAGLSALDSQTGEQRWQFDTRANAAPPTVADGIVYFGTGFEERYVRAVNVEDGEVNWTYRLPKAVEEDDVNGGVYSAPIVVNGAIYVNSADGYLYAFGKA